MTGTTCAIHQPNLFPRPATLAKLAAADVWIVLDDVQLNHRDYQHRARLATITDPRRQQWLTIPIHRPHGRSTRINEALIVDGAASARRLRALTAQYYRRTPHWPRVRDLVAGVADATTRTMHLADITELSTRLLLDTMGWHGHTIRSSTIPTRTGRSTRLADLTHAVHATTYLCGTGGTAYLDERPFTQLGINVVRVRRHTSDRTLSALHQLAVTGTISGNRPPASRIS